MSLLNGSEIRRKYRGLIGVQPKIPIRDTATLSLVYTPGVARPCLEINEHSLRSFDYTMRGNTVGIVTDGSSVYGLGNVGAYAAIPMLEAKSVFHKQYANIDAFPIALDTQNLDEIVEIVRYLSPTFGGFHLEDIASPRCFAIEERLKRAISLPIFHTDQQGSAVSVLAALINALKVVNKKKENAYIVINGAGAAGIATAKILVREGFGNVKVLDRYGALYYRRTEGLNWVKSELARMTNKEDKKGDLAEMLKGADAFIGFSAPGILTPEMIQSMAKNPIIFALALPQPEIEYQDALDAGAKVVATSHSLQPNAINSSLVFPGIFRGALDVRATDITHAMFAEAATAIANLVSEEELSTSQILPGTFDMRVTAKVARAIADTAIKTGIAQVECDPNWVEERMMKYAYEGPAAWIDPPSGKELTLDEEALEIRQRYQGVMGVVAHVPIKDEQIYKNIYSQPEASRPCEEIRDNPEAVYDLTLKNNVVAIVTDGSAVLGLGNIGPGAGLPVMEGKAVLFKTFGGVEAFPICLRTQDPDEIVNTVKRIAPVFGGINLEDISAPRCFDIEQRLTEELDIPVFHDDQHGTATVVLGGFLSAIKAAGKDIASMKIVVNGAGASALSVSRLLLKAGVQDIVICDTKGVIYKGRDVGMNKFKHQIAEITNMGNHRGDLDSIVKGADMFLGLSIAGALSSDMVKSMAKDPIIFALANPVPEIMPDEAYAAGAKVVATGRSDTPNQVNNSLAFPGIFRGALDVRAHVINDEMKIAAAHAIASMIDENQLDAGTIIPAALDFRVPPAVAGAVAQAACDTGVARKPMDAKDVANQLKNYIYEGTLTKA